MIVTVGENPDYDQQDGTRLPMFSRTGRGTNNMYMVFQKHPEGIEKDNKLDQISECSSEDNMP